LDGPSEVGSGIVREQAVPLSQLISLVNERFGTDFNQADQLFFDQIVEAAMADENVKQAAAVNPADKFELVFKSLVETLFVERMDQNEEIFVRFMNDVPFQNVVTTWMASEAYRRLRTQLREASPPTTPRPSVGLPQRIRLVQPRPEDRYVTCVPLIPLKVAAGAFGDPQKVDDDNWEWVTVETKHRMRRGMFVAQVVGRSMEPKIPDGSYCLFAAPVTGRRHGKTVLVQLRDSTDPETGERYTVKRYESTKASSGDSWRHVRITLKPENPEFTPIELSSEHEGQVQVIAACVDVLG
jgi:type I restriction enzyme R subunit